MAQYIYRLSLVTANDASTAITAQGSQATPGGIQVPAGVSQIVQVLATTQNNPGTTAGGHAVFLRLAGNGIPMGEQDIVIGADESVLTTSGAADAYSNPFLLPTAIQVTPGNIITVNGEMGGTGTPAGSIGVCLVFA
jgi:hypothetical protein